MIAIIKGMALGLVCGIFPAMIPFVILLFIYNILKIFAQCLAEISKSIK